MDKLQDRVILITGAGSGIGRATALAFAARGTSVIVADVNEAGGKETVRLIEDAEGVATFALCDVSKEEHIKNAVDLAVQKYGRLDYAFNNAGIEGVSSSTEECTNENWERVITVNLRGVFLCMRHELRQMLKQGGGAIVNCASIAGLVGFAGIPAYTASKHGIIGLTKTAALENAKRKIRVNAVCPGVIATPMIDRFTGKKKEAEVALTAGEPVGRMGKPEEIAEAVVWLCSDAASFTTGIALPVDGGWVAQ